MSRTSRYKLFHTGGLVVVACAALWVATSDELSFASKMLIALVLFIPGRVVGYFWRNQLRGLRLMNEGQFAESKRHSELFLADLARRPWLKHLAWLAPSAYSDSAKALALNNLGAAEVVLGEFDAARAHLAAAMEEDPTSPLPAFNMGVLATQLQMHDEAAQWFDKAVALGYSRGAIDAYFTSLQSLFTRTDGRGTTKP